MGLLTTCTGYVVSDVEKRVTAKGQKMIRFVMAPFGKRLKAVTMNCMIFGDHLNGVIDYVQKGTHIQCTGTMDPPDIYVSKDGEPKSSLKMFVGTLTLLPRGERPANTNPVKSEEQIVEDQLKVDIGGSNNSIDDLPF